MSKQHVQINLSVLNDAQRVQIQEMILAIDPNVSVAHHEDFETWRATLPTEPVEGFNAAAKEWIGNWGDGGGDYSTESCMQDATASNVPSEWALDAYSAVAKYSKSPFDAEQLVMDLINDVLANLNGDVLEVKFTSVWDTVGEVTTDAKYNQKTGRVYAILQSDTTPTGTLEREYITLPNGQELDVEYDTTEDADAYVVPNETEVE